MTAFLAYLHPTACFMAMDTIAPTRSGAIVGHCDKFYLFPHLQMVIVGVGISQISRDWAHLVNSTAAIDNIDTLDKLAPAALLGIAGRTKASTLIQVGVPGSWDMANIYHFGYSPKDKAMVGYRYRSEQSFASERLGYGITCQRGRDDSDLAAVQAFFGESLPLFESGSLPFSEMAIRYFTDLKAREDAKLLEKRCIMGGDLHMVQLYPLAMQTNLIHRLSEVVPEPAAVQESVVSAVQELVAAIA